MYEEQNVDNLNRKKLFKEGDTVVCRCELFPPTLEKDSGDNLIINEPVKWIKGKILRCNPKREIVLVEIPPNSLPNVIHLEGKFFFHFQKITSTNLKEIQNDSW